MLEPDMHALLMALIRDNQNARIALLTDPYSPERVYKMESLERERGTLWRLLEDVTPNNLPPASQPPVPVDTIDTPPRE